MNKLLAFVLLFVTFGLCAMDEDQPTTGDIPVILQAVLAGTNDGLPISEVEVEPVNIGMLHIGPLTSYMTLTEFARYDVKIKSEGHQDVEFQLVVTLDENGQLVATSDNPAVEATVPYGAFVVFLKIALDPDN